MACRPFSVEYFSVMKSATTHSKPNRFFFIRLNNFIAVFHSFIFIYWDDFFFCAKPNTSWPIQSYSHQFAIISADNGKFCHFFIRIILVNLSSCHTLIHFLTLVAMSDIEFSILLASKHIIALIRNFKNSDGIGLVSSKKNPKAKFIGDQNENCSRKTRFWPNNWA